MNGRARVAVDLDNTIIRYDGVFLRAAQARGLVNGDFHGGKRALRDRIRQLPEGEQRWQQVQGDVYGKLISGAELFDGVMAFLRRCAREQADLWVVSHKTEYNAFDPERTNLRHAALRWIEAKGLFNETGLCRDRVFFESSRQDKIARLRVLGCTHVIDDLVEVFADPCFPVGPRKILFDPANPPGNGSWATWHEIEQEIFGPLESGMPRSGNGDWQDR